MLPAVRPEKFKLRSAATAVALLVVPVTKRIRFESALIPVDDGVGDVPRVTVEVVVFPALGIVPEVDTATPLKFVGHAFIFVN